MLMAANQVGKTASAGYEISFHTRGVYPDWWEGRRFSSATNWWVANTNNETTRDNPQRILMGELGQWGTGTIPRSSLAKKPTMARGFPDLIDVVQIKHATGGISTIQFKAYDQGWRKFQGATIRGGIWLDEEPDDMKVYTECLARISAGGGMILITETPLLGMSDVVGMFHPEPSEPFRSLTEMDLDDAGHFTEEEKAIIIAGYPEHERDARARGKPMLGIGKIWKIPKASIEVEHFKIPKFWPRLGGLDFGYSAHPFAAAHIAWDRDNDRLYLVADYKEHDINPPVHASAIRAWGKIRYAWPHDGNREWGTSGPIKDVYRAEGMRMLAEHSTFKGGGYSPNAAIELMISRMKTGRFKAFDTCQHWWQEFDSYHRDEQGQIVAKKNDVTDALFKAVMMLRFAATPHEEALAQTVAGADWDPYDWEE